MQTKTQSLFLACFLMLGVRASGTALTFELPDKTRFCINERFESAKEYVMDYKVIRGGKNDVDVFVRSPNGRVLLKKTQAKDGSFEFESSRGDFAFCFSNEFSSWAHKVVFFDLHPRDIDSLAGEAGVVKPFVKTSSENSCDEIHEKMSSVVKHQRDYRLKESISRHLAEALRTHVTWWGFTQTVAILITGLGQSLILKRFFTEKTSTNLIETET